MDNNERIFDVSNKIFEMGVALIVEGKNTQNKSIADTGCFLTMISGVILSENDISEFSNLCSMFSAKKMLDGLEQKKSDLTNFLDNPNISPTEE